MDEALGRSVAVHRGTFASASLDWYLGAIFTASGILALFSTIRPAASENRLTLALTGAGALLVGLLLLLAAFARYRQVVEVFEQGFVWTRLTGRRVVARSAIAKCELITSNSGGTTLTRVTLTLVDQEELELAGFENPEQLANLLRPSAIAGVSVPTGAGLPGGWRPPTV